MINSGFTSEDVESYKDSCSHPNNKKMLDKLQINEELLKELLWQGKNITQNLGRDKLLYGKTGCEHLITWGRCLQMPHISNKNQLENCNN